MKKSLTILLSLMFISAFTLEANNLSTARSLYKKGEYAKALPIFQKEYKRKPKDGSINHWIGVCLYETGKSEEAIPYLEYADTRKVIESSHYLAKINYKAYRFQEAYNNYVRYGELLADSKKKMSTRASREFQRVKNAQNMLDHVEKIVVLDSIVVDKEDFFEQYEISPETGSLNSKSVLSVRAKNNTVVFKSQSGERMMWAMPDSANVMRLCESTKLVDGEWDTPQYLSKDLNDGGSANYPFMMQDGSTLYYASNGNGSIGGYDIYITRRDAETGEYLRPQNMGLPYNSLADDYLLVLDDIRGLGWWATDRNKIPGKLTIYVFMLTDMRENYKGDEPNLIEYAKLSNFRKTWGEQDYSNALNEKLVMPETDNFESDNDFVFHVGKGIIYKSYVDFDSEEASAKMDDLIEMKKAYDSTEKTLKAKRREFYLAKKDERVELKRDILTSEKLRDKLRANIIKTENEIRKLEQNHKD